MGEPLPACSRMFQGLIWCGKYRSCACALPRRSPTAVRPWANHASSLSLGSPPGQMWLGNTCRQELPLPSRSTDPRQPTTFQGRSDYMRLTSGSGWWECKGRTGSFGEGGGSTREGFPEEVASELD